MRTLKERLQDELDKFTAEITDQEFDCYGTHYILKDDWKTAINNLISGILQTVGGKQS